MQNFISIRDISRKTFRFFRLRRTPRKLKLLPVWNAHVKYLLGIVPKDKRVRVAAVGDNFLIPSNDISVT